LQDEAGTRAPLIPRVVFFTVSALVVALDIVTKRMVVARMDLHDVHRVFGDYVRLTYIHNPGAAFGLFPGSRVALIGISVAAAVIVLVAAWKPGARLRTLVPLGLVLGGAIGNLIDRIRLGEVVDFIQVGVPPRTYWPIFNVADSAVTVGVVWIALTLIGKEKAAEPAGLSSPREDPVAGMESSRDGG
jgi:signal peptidase II